MRRPSISVLPGLAAAVLLSFLSLGAVAPVSAGVAAATTTCANGVDDTPGLGLICQVTIVNTITKTGGSARVVIHECHGAAGDPTAACTTKTTNLTKPVKAVTQCNSSTNGGGGTLRCSVRVTNRFIGLKPTIKAVTVNECVGSGGGITTGCDPFPATTTGAKITQCNGSANGGTLVQLRCTATGTRSSVNAVTINQCNGSTNGGGALVICSANQSNVIVPTSSGGGATPGSSGTTGSNGGTSPSAPATDTVEPAGVPSGVSGSLTIAFLAFLAILTLVASVGRTRVRVPVRD